MAANVREADFIESILDDEAVHYEQRLEVNTDETSGVCYQGVLFEVSAGEAEHCRRLLREQGLGRGVVESPQQ